MPLIVLSLIACKDGGDVDSAPANAAPEITSLALSPAEAGAGDAITVVVEASDADGDSLTYSYSWTVDGAEAGDDSDTLSAGSATKGQSVVVSVTVSDGEEEVSSESAALTIGNTAPTGGSAEIAPSAPSVSEDLLCRLAGEPTDLDGDALSYQVTWTVDGAPVTPQGADSQLPGDHVLAEQTRGDQTWACEITADDGEGTLALGATVTLPPAPEVLLIWDVLTEGTPALVESLEADGIIVTLSDTSETAYDGTNPPLAGFDTVIHLNGEDTYTTEMPVAGQSALVAFVNSGGGFISTEWDAYEVGEGRHTTLQDIIPMHRDSGSGTTNEIYTLQGTHPVTDGLPAEFTVTTYCHGNRGSAVEAATVIATSNSYGDAVAVMDYGAGQVVGFAHAGNYGNDSTNLCMESESLQAMMANAVWWTAGL